MRILAADDEELQLNKLKKAILDVVPEAELITFNKPSAILNWAKQERWPCGGTQQRLA